MWRFGMKCASWRRAPLAPADKYPKPSLAAAVPDKPHPDIMKTGRRPVLGTGGDGDLELAWQKGEFGMQRRPLADDFGPDPRILDFIMRRAGERVAGDIADTVPQCLDGVHVESRQPVENVGGINKPDPVELDFGGS